MCYGLVRVPRQLGNSLYAKPLSKVGLFPITLGNILSLVEQMTNDGSSSKTFLITG